ncbi:hypothetical protein [Rhodococcus tukisamuensis]|uniref:Uncharacterized protein n=1 Tax=Rhodococcus tukisamuensis TaxID=168276 RepID=A0A1G6QYK0_9NOCA|nr:hypothetical protein [Rhodococcus tukisamuensis]SDC97378.1 hypothetical protein SAMN05444580_102262 [Rhodococcus tukisamuensis]
MTTSAKSSTRRFVAKVALTGALAVLPLGLAVGPALAGTHAGSCNFDGNVKWVKDCPDTK